MNIKIACVLIALSPTGAFSADAREEHKEKEARPRVTRITSITPSEEQLAKMLAAISAWQPPESWRENNETTREEFTKFAWLISKNRYLYSKQDFEVVTHSETIGEEWENISLYANGDYDGIPTHIKPKSDDNRTPFNLYRSAERAKDSFISFIEEESRTTTELWIKLVTIGLILPSFFSKEAHCITFACSSPYLQKALKCYGEERTIETGHRGLDRTLDKSIQMFPHIAVEHLLVCVIAGEVPE